MCKTILIILLSLNLGLIAKCQKCGDFYNRKRQDFKFKGKFHLNDSSKIKTSGVYLYRYFSETDSTKSISRYYRFYKDGRVFISGNYCNYYPSLDDFRDTVYGGISYYRIKNTTIEIEFYGGEYSGYVIETGIIYDTSKLIFLSYKSRGWSATIDKYPRPREMFFVPIK